MPDTTHAEDTHRVWCLPIVLKNAVSFLAVSVGFSPNCAASDALDWGETETTTSLS